jgi:membrane protein implicated in regulation of membrane protease activity
VDPRFLREIEIRVGMAAILVAVFTILMGVDWRLWLLPPAVALLIWLKWRMAPPEEDEMDDRGGPSDAGADDGAA